MFGLGKLFNRGASAAKRLENKDEFEAFVWGGVGICYADGSCDQEEIDALKDMLRNDDNMKPFINEIDVTVDNVVGKFKQSPTRSRIQTMRELSDLNSAQEAKENVMATLFDLADMGGREESENEVLREYAKALNVSLSPFGL